MCLLVSSSLLIVICLLLVVGCCSLVRVVRCFFFGCVLFVVRFYCCSLVSLFVVAMCSLLSVVV